MDYTIVERGKFPTEMYDQLRNCGELHEVHIPGMADPLCSLKALLHLQVAHLIYQ